MSAPDEKTVEFTRDADTLAGYRAPRNTVSLRFGGASHTGKVRQNNEDHYAIVRRTRTREILRTNVDVAGLSLPYDHAWVLVVADGIGGHGFGELASDLVLRFSWELAGEATSWIMKFDPAEWPAIQQNFNEFTQRLQSRLREQSRQNPKLLGMGTTWTCLYIVETAAIVAHVGDSRAYLFRSSTLRQLTRDHTLAQHMQDKGFAPKTTEQYSHILVNSFGAHENALRTDVDHVPLEYADRLLVCSDGLTDMVPEPEIAEALKVIDDPQAACEVLIELALQHGGKDNVTVIVADILPADAPPFAC